MATYAEDISSITLRRGACFGTCPIYEVTLRADGAATWDGERFVDRLGHHEGEVDVFDFGRLARFVERAGFFGWDPEHRANVTDLPDYVLTVVRGTETTSVLQNGVDEPADFWVIARLVDGLACAIEWTPVPADGATNCHDWSAVHDRQPPGPAVLRVHGTCTFETAGFTVELQRMVPQGINPKDLMLKRVVTPPTGVVAQVVTDVEVDYSEEADADFDTVSIHPEGLSIAVQVVH
jgi:hypothetical protein